MATQPIPIFTAVFIVENDQLLLLKHVKADEIFYTLPGGKAEPGELCSDAAMREVLEEVGLEIDKNKLHFAHTLSRKINDQSCSLVLFFNAESWHNSPYNKEPEKHAELSWHQLNNLPAQLRSHHRQALELWRKNIAYSEWVDPKPNDIARQALADFLNRSVDAISCTTLTGGSDTDKVINCTHLETNYVVKLFNDHAFGKNEIAWTRLASDLGIGPKLYNADPQGSSMIMELAPGSSLVPTTANSPAVLKAVAASLAKLHHSAAPFAQVSDLFTRIQTKYEKLQCSCPLQSFVGRGFSQVEKIQTLLQNLTVAPVPCHNDLNPGNIFEHNNRVILIDWGDAALGDPYYDIAAFFVLNVIDPKNERLFLEHYDPKLLDGAWTTCMQLYKQVVHFEFALNLLLGVQASNRDLLYMRDLPPGNDLSYYLTVLAERNRKIDSFFAHDGNCLTQ